MNDLAKFAMDAHGGLDRWRQLNKISGEPTRFSTWARENFPIQPNATDGALH
jgi:hypothetical protein